MKNRPLSIALASIGVAGLLITMQAPADAAKGDPKKKDPGPDLTETGCRDVVDGSARYDRDRTQPEIVWPDPKTYPDAFQLSSGTVTLSLILSAPSCTDVTYALDVWSSDGTLLTTYTTQGDGVSGTQDQRLVLTTKVSNYANDCLAASARTIVSGTVVDTAPDAINDYSAVCDGGGPGLTYK